MMKNTLRYVLTILGIVMMIFGVFAVLFPRYVEKTIFEEPSQSFAMIVFGGLCLISGMAYKRR